MSEYDERMKECWKISGGNFIVEMIDVARLEYEVKMLNTMPLRMRAFVLGNSRLIINDFIRAINGFYTNDLYYKDTDSMYTENKHSDKLDRADLVGKNLLQGNQKDYKDGGIFLDCS